MESFRVYETQHKTMIYKGPYEATCVCFPFPTLYVILGWRFHRFLAFFLCLMQLGLFLGKSEANYYYYLQKNTIGVGGGNNRTLSGNRNITGSITKSRHCQSSLCCFNVSSMLRRSWPWWLHRSGTYTLPSFFLLHNLFSFQLKHALRSVYRKVYNILYGLIKLYSKVYNIRKGIIRAG